MSRQFITVNWLRNEGLDFSIPMYFIVKVATTETSVVTVDTTQKEESSRPLKDCMEEMKLFIIGDVLRISAEASR